MESILVKPLIWTYSWQKNETYICSFLIAISFFKWKLRFCADLSLLWQVVWIRFKYVRWTKQGRFFCLNMSCSAIRKKLLTTFHFGTELIKPWKSLKEEILRKIWRNLLKLLIIQMHLKIKIKKTYKIY